MPRVIITEGAAQGLVRCRQFLAEKNPHASKRAGQIIAEHLSLLESNPDIGRPLDELPDMRELVIPFGDSGYVGLYRFEPEPGIVYLLAFRHQKGAGY